MIDSSFKYNDIKEPYNRISVFFKMCPKSVFHHIAEYSNKHLFRSEKSKLNTYPTDEFELINFFRIRLIMTMKHSLQNSTIESYYNNDSIKKTNWIYLRRFRMLHSRVHGNIDQIMILLRKSFANCWRIGQVATVDELMVDYRSKKSNFIVNFPRKPHPTGYLIYFLSSLSNECHLPIVYDLSTLWFKKNHSFHTMVKNFAKNVLNSDPSLAGFFHIISDSAFGSIDLINELNLMKVKMTSSIRSSYDAKWWECMMFGVKGYMTGRTMYRTKHGMISNFVLTNKKHLLLTTSFGLKNLKSIKLKNHDLLTTQVANLKEEIKEHTSQLNQILQTLTTITNQTHELKIIEMVNSSIQIQKKNNRKFNKTLNTISTNIESILHLETIKKVMARSTKTKGNYIVLTNSGIEKEVSSTSLINFEGKIEYPFLEFCGSEDLFYHFNKLSLQNMKIICSNLGLKNRK